MCTRIHQQSAHHHTCVQSLHQLEDEVIESGGVLDGRNERHQLALDLACSDTLGGVKVR